MNIIKVKVNFKKGTCDVTGIKLVTGDYNSTIIKLTMSDVSGTNIFNMKSPSDDLVLSTEIVNGEVHLYRENEKGVKESILAEKGNYTFEIAKYDGDSKLTSAYGKIPVRKAQVNIDGELVEPYLPIFDGLMSQLSALINQVNNLNINVEKEGNITTLTITDKTGEEKVIQILDGEQGPVGPQGPPGEQPTVPTKLSDLSDDSTHRTVTDVEKNNWNNKSDFSGAYADLTGKPNEVTESTVSNWGFTKNKGTYSKPSGGIPKTDLASAVQTSLGKADSALQEHQPLKTINGNVITGTGNIVIESGTGGLTSVAHDNTMIGSGTNVAPLAVDTTKFATAAQGAKADSALQPVSGKGLSTNDFTNTYKNNVDSNTTARHSHSNKTVLDGISSQDITNWNNNTAITAVQETPPTNPSTKIWIKPSKMARYAASYVVDSMEGTDTDKAPSVDSVKKYVNNKNTYSTDEIVIGTYLGKPLYRKVLTGKLPTGKGENTFNLSSECSIKRKYGRIKSNLGAIFELDTYYTPSVAYSISSWISADEHTLKVECGANYNANSEYEITVEYTKTTD